MKYLQLFVPFLGTTLGALTVFIFKDDKIDPRIEKVLMGFASGIMIAASLFSLLMPALEANEGPTRVIPPVIGFLAGIFFLLILDSLLPHLHVNSNNPEGLHSKKPLSKMIMVFIAVTLHNIPEGAAAGVALVSSGASEFITASGTFALLLGIAIQNFPEGAIVSLPLRTAGYSKFKAFMFGMMSGIAEPIASVLVILASSLVSGLLPYSLAFAAGAMIYVTIEELIPEANAGKHSNIATISFAFGFVVMMLLDVLLG